MSESDDVPRDDPETQYELALQYENGDGVDRDVSKVHNRQHIMHGPCFTARPKESGRGRLGTALPKSEALPCAQRRSFRGRRLRCTHERRRMVTPAPASRERSDTLDLPLLSDPPTNPHVCRCFVTALGCYGSSFWFGEGALPCSESREIRIRVVLA